MVFTRLILLLLPLSLGAQNSATPFGAKDKLEYHAKVLVAPTTFLSSVASAGIQQWRDAPTEWGQGAAGYGRRFANSYGYNVSRHLLEFALDSALREDPRYFPTGEHGTWRRASRAALHALRHRTDSGRTTWAYASVGSAYAAGGVARAWQPDRLRTPGDALVSGTITIGLDAATSVFKEFWPDIRKRMFHR